MWKRREGASEEGASMNRPVETGVGVEVAQNTGIRFQFHRDSAVPQVVCVDFDVWVIHESIVGPWAAERLVSRDPGVGIGLRNCEQG